MDRDRGVRMDVLRGAAAMTPSLFDWAQRARLNDKETSIEAARDTASVLTVRRQQFLHGLERIGGTGTANEVAREASEDHSLRESIRKRAHELVRLGAIVEAGTKTCNVSGRRATAYRLA